VKSFTCVDCGSVGECKRSSKRLCAPCAAARNRKNVRRKAKLGVALRCDACSSWVGGLLAVFGGETILCMDCADERERGNA